MRREANNHHDRNLHISLHENHSILNPYPSHLPLVEITSLPSILYTNPWPIRRLRECYKKEKRATSLASLAFHHHLSLSLSLFLPSTTKNLQDTSRTFKKNLSRTSRDKGAHPFDESFSSFENRAVTRSYSVRWI